jgi:hypothetical protein
MKAYCWRKGQTGNPKGRPRGKSLVGWIKAVGYEDLPKDIAKKTGARTWNELLARSATKRAESEHSYFKSILDIQKEQAELSNQFLEIVNSCGLTLEQIKSDPTFYEAALRCGYISDGEGEGGEDSGGADV